VTGAPAADTPPEAAESDLVDIIFAGLDLVADREDFLPALFEVVEGYLCDEVAFAPLAERVKTKERLVAGLLLMAKRLLAFHPAAVGEA
jgi:hypothetical protein